MASTSGTFTAAQQLSSVLLLRVGESLRMTLTPSGGTWTVSLVAQQGNPARAYAPLRQFSSTQSGYTYKNTTTEMQFIALKCERVDGGTVAYTLADITGDQVLVEDPRGGWYDASDQLVAKMTDRGLLQLTGDVVDVRGYGAIGDGDVSNAATNVAAFRAAIAAAAAGQKNLYIPAGTYRVNDNMTFDGDCSGMTVYGDGPSSVIKISTSLDTGSNAEAGWTIILNGASNGALENFRLTGIRVDGNRGNITGLGVSTTRGIVAYQDSSLHNVQVDNCWAQDYENGSGFFTFAAGIRFVNCWSFGHEEHGFGQNYSTNFGDADKFAEFYNCTAHDCDGYGMDVNRGRTLVANANLYFNTLGGFKFADGTEYLSVEGMRCGYNLGLGFTDTDTIGTGKIFINGLVTHNNGNIGFSCRSAGSLVVGRLESYDNYCRSGASRSGFGYTGGTPLSCDVLFGDGSSGTLNNFTADFVSSRNSPVGGILIDGQTQSYVIQRVEAEYAETYGFSDLSTGPGHGVVLSGLIRGNNQAAAAAGASAAAFVCNRSGTMKTTGIIFEDDQGSPTQNTGFYFANTVQAYVDGCHFGTGLTAGSEVVSATAGTIVRFGNGNTGSLVTRARGTMAANGGSTTASETFATAMSNLGGAVYFVQAVPASVDAAVDWYVSTANRTTFTITKASGSFTAGTGNVSVRYDVQMEIQR